MSTTLDPRHYIEYFKWNDELIDHFFHKRHTEIRLYADENILKEVGEKVGIESEDYKSLFYSSGSASLLPSHGRGIWPRDVLKEVSRGLSRA